MVVEVCLLVLLIHASAATTSIRTYATVNIHENVPVGTSIVSLQEKNAKLYLLNLGGFERRFFEVQQQGSVHVRENIDREEFLQSKRCFDRSYCLIELHILVNDGQQYLVIPIHIVE